ncbi:TolC family protein [Maribacter sp. R86514]|uniref:TolC family protein n=1 Tax=Maribacter sp. R86514 TaxID=3093854 RepID=UPI0037C83375
MNKKFKITTLLLLSIWGSIMAQDNWSLDECVAYALEHNLQLNDFKYTNQSNRETYRQSVRNLLPSVNASSSYFIKYGRQTNPEDNSIVNTDIFSNDYSMDGSFDLFQGFQKINAIKASKYLYKAAKEESLQQKYLLAFEVMSAYYDVQFIQGLIKISKEQVEISQTNFKLVNRQVELGVMARADLYEAESLLLTDELTLMQNINRLKASKLVLIQAMNIQGREDINIRPELIGSKDDDVREFIISDSLFIKAKEFMPSVKAQELRVKAAEKQLGATRGTLYPSLSLLGGIGTGYFQTITDGFGETIGFRDQFRGNRYDYLGARLSVPIFNAWANRSNVKQQKIELERAKNNSNITDQELHQIVQQLVQEYDALTVETTQTQKRMKSQNLAFNIAQKRYERGMINVIELGQAKTLFATAQNENLQAQLKLRVNKSTIDFYQGLPVFNIN